MLPKIFARLASSRPDRPLLMRYGLAVLLPTLAFLLTLRMPEIETRSFFTFFLAAVTLACWYGGWKPGLLATFISAMASAWLAPPIDSFQVASRSDAIRLIAFVLASLLICSLSGVLHSTQKALHSVQQALRASEEQFLGAQKIAKIWAWEFDVKTRQLTWSNPYRRPEVRVSMRYESWLPSVHPEDRARLEQAVMRALEEGQYEAEYRVLSQTSGPRWLSGRGQVFHDEAGKPVRMVGLNMDVTARKQAEEGLRSGESSAATARLAATIAQESLNSVKLVDSLLQLLENRLSPDPTARHSVILARGELARITRMTGQILQDYRGSTAPVQVNPSRIVDEILQSYTPPLTSPKVTLEKRLSYEGEIQAIPGEIRQALSNLLQNALEAVGEEGVIKVETFESSDHGNPSRRGVRVVVSDNGPGIPAELQQKIFEPFFTTKAEKGLGLGLWVTQGIVQKHGGSIRVHSSTEPGRSGTSISVFLPQAEADVTPDKPAATPQATS